LLAVDEKLSEQLDRRSSLDSARREYEALDDEIKQRFKLTAGDRFVCGNWLITKKPHGKGTRIDIEKLESPTASGV
jgi:hypothetical protein